MVTQLDLDRARSFIDRGPACLPDPSTLLWPSASQVSSVLWPLVARRNLKRFLLASARLTARAAPVVAERYERMAGAVLGLDDATLEQFLVAPELTSWLVGAEQTDSEPARMSEFLAGSVASACALGRVDLPRVPCAITSREALELRALATTLVTSRPLPDRVEMEVRDGFIVVQLGGHQIELPPRGDTVELSPSNGHPEVLSLPTVDGTIVCSALPNRWLELAMPDAGALAHLDRDGLGGFAASMREGAQVVAEVWPDAWAELLVILRWLLPLADDDSYYGPGFRGLIALQASDPVRVACDLVHEGSHNKLSSILELTELSRNPDDLVDSPFARGRGPVTSLIHSCWSFTRELVFLRRLREAGLLDGASDRGRVERKFLRFFELGLPVVRRYARLTETGDAVITEIERTLAA
jgi:HEXXH motif-containing protein